MAVIIETRWRTDAVADEHRLGRLADEQAERRHVAERFAGEERGERVSNA
jgi:hypothetical protein